MGREYLEINYGHHVILLMKVISELSVISQNSCFVNSTKKPSLTSLSKTESLGSQNGRSSRGKPQAWLDPRFQMIVS